MIYILTGWRESDEDFPEEIDITHDAEQVAQARRLAAVPDVLPEKSFIRYPMKAEDVALVLGHEVKPLRWELVLQRLYVFR